MPRPLNRPRHNRVMLALGTGPKPRLELRVAPPIGRTRQWFARLPERVWEDDQRQPPPGAVIFAPRRAIISGTASTSAFDVRKFTIHARSANLLAAMALERKSSPLCSTAVKRSWLRLSEIRLDRRGR